ncbi:hypothetical protein ACTA71_003766 [Dictyostelium dimigraforme]
MKYVINQNKFTWRIASQCDYITFYKPSPPLQQQQQQQQQRHHQRQQQQQQQQEQIQLLLTSSLENIQLMSKKTKNIEGQFKESCNIYTLVYLSNEKLSFGNDFSENWETLERFNCIFDQRLAGANYFIGELCSFGKWYDLFDECSFSSRVFDKTISITIDFGLLRGPLLKIRTLNLLDNYDRSTVSNTPDSITKEIVLQNIKENNCLISDGRSTNLKTSVISNFSLLLTSNSKDSCDEKRKSYVIPVAVVASVAGVAAIGASGFLIYRKKES